MRNIAVYPVTHEEKINALKAAIKNSLADGAIGSIEPAALTEVLEELEKRGPSADGQKASA